MPDLNKKNTAKFVQITGSDAGGDETTPVKSFDTSELATADILDDGGDNNEITINATAIEAKVGATRLPNRKLLRIYNSGTTVLYWGFNASTTAIGGARPGEPIFKKQWMSIDVGDVAVYVVSSAAGGAAVIIEGS